MTVQRPVLSLWVWWLITFAPVPLFTLFAALLISQTQFLYIVFWLVPSIALACGIVTGILQHRVLSRYLPNLRRWVWATCAGTGLLWLITMIMPLAIPMMDVPIGGSYVEGWYGLSMWVWRVTWLSTGIAQWLVLRKYVQLAGLWMFVNTLAAVIGSYLGPFMAAQFGVEVRVVPPNSFAELVIPPQAWVAGTTVAILVEAVFAATTIVWLLRPKLLRDASPAGFEHSVQVA